MDSNQSQSDTLSLLKAGKLLGSRQLKLSCGLNHFPKEIFDLADTLEVLDLSGNALSSLPDDLSRLHKLRILFCSSNRFTHVPEALGECQSLSMIGFKSNKISHLPEESIPTKMLRWFIMTDNVIKALPASLGDCKHMQKLMLAGNQLSKLPESLANCKNLELLRISANKLESLPDWLFSLPKLSWLGYAGNPFCNQVENSLLAKRNIPKIDWHALHLQQLLGEGASGLIYQALWKAKNATGDSENKAVAVKMFKANITSDGLPCCEVHATALAGQHPNLLGFEGVIDKHPDSTAGLVLPLMDADLTVLANPPSFETCSRDVYAPNTQLTLDTVLHIAHSIASVVAHLHKQGITHGDLYAHNILSNGQGKCILSDFGGASFLPKDNIKHSQQLQRLETRAFACLLEELLEHCAIKNHTTEALWQLQAECAQHEIGKRPLFNEITQQLSFLRKMHVEQNLSGDGSDESL